MKPELMEQLARDAVASSEDETDPAHEAWVQRWSDRLIGACVGGGFVLLLVGSAVWVSS